MFVVNGIVYASEISDNIQIVDVKPLEDMMMILTFSTGEQRLFDATVLSGSAFEPLSNPEVFNNYTIVDGIVTWLNKEIDCAPEYMYENSYPYTTTEMAI